MASRPLPQPQCTFRRATLLASGCRWCRFHSSRSFHQTCSRRSSRSRYQSRRELRQRYSLRPSSSRNCGSQRALLHRAVPLRGYCRTCDREAPAEEQGTAARSDRRRRKTSDIPTDRLFRQTEELDVDRGSSRELHCDSPSRRPSRPQTVASSQSSCWSWCRGSSYR
jgi:hypothetical protein